MMQLDSTRSLPGLKQPQVHSNGEDPRKWYSVEKVQELVCCFVGMEVCPAGPRESREGITGCVLKLLWLCHEPCFSLHSHMGTEGMEGAAEGTWWVL